MFRFILIVLFALSLSPVQAEESAKPAVPAVRKRGVKKKVKKSARKKVKKRRRKRRWPTRRPEEAISGLPKLGKVPFPEGERLAFEVKMLGAVAGEVVLAAGKRSKKDGRQVRPLVGFLRSSDFLGKFYPIKDKLVTLVDEESFLPIKTDFYIKEKSKQVDYHTNFDQKKHHVHSLKRRYNKDPKKKAKERKREFRSIAPLYEGLSSIYAARRLDLKPGLKFQYYIWDGRKERLVSVEVVGIEDVQTGIGFVKATRVNISSKITGGFISASLLNSKPTLGSTWFALDKYHTPVKMISPTKLGEAQATLVRRWIEK